MDATYQVLLDTAQEHGLKITDERFAQILDERDPLKHLREQFHVPTKAEALGSDLADGIDGSQKCVYLAGNSLGLQPVGVKQLVCEEPEKWKNRGVLGHFTGQRPWLSIEDIVNKQSGVLVGSHDPGMEVIIMNSLTANLHFGMVAFYRPTATRHKVLMEHKAFPSDHYAVESQIRFHGYDPAVSLATVDPREGEDTLRTEDIVAKIMDEGDSIALVLFSGVQYFTGQFFNIAAITEAAHSKGCYVGIDLAHAVGNVELHLTDWGVDFACWCNYKYMNAGPGAVGGFFIHKKHARDFTIPRFLGWWAHKRESRFEMNNRLELQPGAAGFQLSNPPMLEMINLFASLKVFEQTTIKDLRKKSLLLTGYMELLLKQNFSRTPEGEQATAKRPRMADGVSVEIISPSEPDERGCQLSVRFPCLTEDVHQKLHHRGVICDTRKPNVMRVAPTPLYNTFTDVLMFFKQLEQTLQATI